ncbi:MAG: DUF2225 domain-containing protein [Lachnospiraceae bacterium]|nr:DUF2225 domain-containing protein [Lachnospiraceae bacterium]
MGLFSGLESLGLGKMKGTELYEKDAAKEDVKGANSLEKTQPQKKEEDVLFDKKYECPVCGKEFTSKTIRAGKNKLLSQELDLRAKYDTADAVKYDPVVCYHCGFAALGRFFKPIPSAQEKLVRENICNNFKGLKMPEAEYSYDDAIMRYKLVLATTVVKCGKNSEKAYVCLKMAWAFRGKAESLPADIENRQAVLKELQDAEMECLKNAYEGFNSAFSQESFPMCGMDETTVTYLVAELARRIGKYEEAGRWISQILVSRTASERLKDKAREVKELISKEK